MRFNFKECTEEELWKYVASHLKNRDIDTVLVGGAVVSIYTNGAYQSGDLDFITLKLFADELPDAMYEIGFKKVDKRHYEHPQCHHLFVEFPPGPLGIGEDVNIKPRTLKTHGVAIKILSPTDCVKDRLASYIHFNDREGFDQAVLVAGAQPINPKEIKRWCEVEGANDVYDELVAALRK